MTEARYFTKDYCQASWDDSAQLWRVKRYDIDTDVWIESLVKDENFQKYYHKDEPNAQQNTKAGSNDGSGRPQSTVCQEGGNSSESGEGIQQSRRGQKPKVGQTLRIAYNINIDGWSEVPKKVRAPDNSPYLIWMKPETWQMLANCATRDGVFYIPVIEGRQEAWQMCQLVAELEKSS